MRHEALAKVIPFPTRAQTRVGPPWTTAELGELFRVSHVLRQSGMPVGTDLGLSDEGDPWFIFYNLQTDDVIAHFARINGEIIVHGLLSDGIVSGNDLHGVIRRLRSVQTLGDRQQSQTDRSVVFHPFMLLVAFLAASFLAAEESQAASPSERLDKPAGEGDASARERQAKVKLDWIERAIALLDSKVKERSEGTPADLLSASRKMGSEDSLQPAMALVMLAAAISCAQKEVFSSDDLAGNNLDSALKSASDAHRVTADAVAASLDPIDASALTTVIPSQTVSNASPPKAPSHPDTANSFNATNVALLEPGNGAIVTLPSLLFLGKASPPSLPSDTAPPASSPARQPDSFLVLEAPEAPATRIEAPAAENPRNVAPSAASGTVPAASIHLTYEGGTLHFHRILSDTRRIDVVLGESDPLKVEKGTASVSLPELGSSEKPVLVDASRNAPGSSAEPRWITLTNAHEHVLIGNGDTRIKNFSLGVDRLVFEDPLLFEKLPEVHFTATGDVVFGFSATVRVTLLGVLENTAAGNL